MTIKKLNASELRHMDTVIVPRGYGKHRGVAEDSGVFKVVSSTHWTTEGKVAVFLDDSVTESFGYTQVSPDQKLEVMR